MRMLRAAADGPSSADPRRTVRNCGFDCQWRAAHGRLRAMKPIADARLYAILDLGYVAPADAVRVAEKLIGGGIDLLQFRAKGIAEEDVKRLPVG